MWARSGVSGIFEWQNAIWQAQLEHAWVCPIWQMVSWQTQLFIIAGRAKPPTVENWALTPPSIPQLGYQDHGKKRGRLRRRSNGYFPSSVPAAARNTFARMAPIHCPNMA